MLFYFFLELKSLFETLNSATKILPKRSTEPGGVTFKNSCQKAADTLSLTIDGKQKEFDDAITYANIKSLLKNIQKSSYFDKLNQPQQSMEANELRKWKWKQKLITITFQMISAVVF